MKAEETFFQHLKECLKNDTLISLSLGDYKGPETQLKKLSIKPVLIKGQKKYSIVYRYQTNDITKNYSIEESQNTIKNQFGATGFGFAKLITKEYEIEVQRLRTGDFKLKKKNIVSAASPSLSHDKVKNRKIEATNKKYLHLLGITNENGEVKKTGQDKFKQINHYIEILSSLLENLPTRDLHIVDMGSGKGYLTFALYDYLTTNLGRTVTVTGVEYRQDLVTLCNEIAQKSGLEKLSFVQGTIENYKPASKIDVLIALHACDTATDDAIFKGLTNDADLIVVAPCCHKQIRREIEKGKKQNDLDFLIKHGILLERQAEMVTDGLRALLLEYKNYKTKIFEFIATEHTPKNVLIVGEKSKSDNANQEEILQRIKDRKEYFGIEKHHLEKLLFTK